MGCGNSTPAQSQPVAPAPPVKQEPQKAAKPEAAAAAGGGDVVIPPELANGVKNLTPLFCHHNDYYIACTSKDGLNFAVCEAAGTVYHSQLTDKQLLQHNDLKALTKWPGFFTSLAAQFQAHAMRVKIDKTTGGATLHLTTDGKKTPFNVQLEKKGADPALKHKHFLEPLIAHHMRIKTDKALEATDNKLSQLEVSLNTIRLSVADDNTKLKTSEQEIEALRAESKKKQLAIQELKDSCSRMASRLRKLRDPSGLPDLYAWRTGPKCYPLHHPMLPIHDPVMKAPNAVALAAIRAKYARDQSQYIKKDDAPVPVEALEEEFHKALSAAKDPRSHEPILQMMNTIDDFAFDVFAAEAACGGQALVYITYALFHKYGLSHHFGLDDETLVRFLNAVHAGYHPNPFHNATHAADVVQCMHYFITPGGMKDVLKMTPDDCFAALLAACVHDFDHPGVNNNFHARSHSYLSTLYNDRSTLENHSCASVFDLIKNEPFNIFSNVAYDSWKQIRESVLETVLNTDLGVHFRVFSQFKKKVGTDGEWGKLENMRLALSAALKAADISNVARPTPLYVKWAKALSEEFYRQGDLEHQLGLTVTPFFVRARHKTDFVQSQEVFCKFIAQPLFDAMGEIFPGLKSCSERIQANKEALAHDATARAELQLA